MSTSFIAPPNVASPSAAALARSIGRAGGGADLLHRHLFEVVARGPADLFLVFAEHPAVRPDVLNHNEVALLKRELLAMVRRERRVHRAQVRELCDRGLQVVVVVHGHVLGIGRGAQVLHQVEVLLRIFLLLRRAHSCLRRRRRRALRVRLPPPLRVAAAARVATV